MTLQSRLLSTNQRLRDCETRDAAHVVPGEHGAHVGLIQQALIQLEDEPIAVAELTTETYGATTAAGVLRYKTKRRIINKAYQQQADDIVGRMTIKSLDDEMTKLEAGPVAGDMRVAMLRPILKRLT